MPGVLVPIADGTEEIEAVTIIDVLRRAGAEVTVASVAKQLQITASRGVILVADKTIADCVTENFDLIALPGGIPGAEHLRDSADLIRILKRQKNALKPFAAICAAPAVVLDHHGLIRGKEITCHPGFSHTISKNRYVNKRVVSGDGFVTSQGPGTAMAFALALVALLFGKEKAAEVAAPMVI